VEETAKDHLDVTAEEGLVEESLHQGEDQRAVQVFVPVQLHWPQQAAELFEESLG
jgi:hypothetical protein